ncbi:L-lysine 6-monooxygenase (NADPH-requiring) [Teratosphaeria destructans]|uniref:L-lysine 6-monooxygenase (NADPH-requiring) n=1 Tax=Teratosphaeria destructans TaxID=418781 RepID=A0A9W7SNK6_9PEZI|nr:L-lysine 6-monooxygenase (NADPH-requiring) [Teratosphaeria destructans]
MLSPMEIQGVGGVSLNEHWERHHGGAAQAYLGSCVPGFPNFFTLMGPNTVTGHHSVIYTVECQINFLVRLITPILRRPRDVTVRARDAGRRARGFRVVAARAGEVGLEFRLHELGIGSTDGRQYRHVSAVSVLVLVAERVYSGRRFRV